MSKVAVMGTTQADGGRKGTGGTKKLVLLAVPVALTGIVAGLWFSGVLPPLLGLGQAATGHEPVSVSHDASAPPVHGAAGENPSDNPHAASAGGPGVVGGPMPIFFEIPDIIANLNSTARRSVYVKVKPRLELSRAEDEPVVRAALPRLMDMFQTYLREVRPEELRGSAGMYRMHEELLARAKVAVTPAKINDILFVEMLIQ